MGTSTLAQELERFFLARDYKWGIGDSLRNPTDADIQKVLDQCVLYLMNHADDEAQLETGRLIVRRMGDIYDVYVHFGCFNG